MTEVFVIPIASALCTSSNFRGVLARCFESTDRCAGLAGNFQSKVLFEKKESEALGETTVLQNRLHPSQQRIFDLLGTHCPPPSPVFFTLKFIHPGRGPSGNNMHTNCRRLVPLQEGQRAIQPQARRLCYQAPIRRLQGEPISQRVLSVRAGRSSHLPEPWRPPIHQ